MANNAGNRASRCCNAAPQINAWQKNSPLAEWGISVHRSTIYRWFIEYATILRKKFKKYQFIRTVSSWRLDETYVKVNGKWFYLYCAIDKYGDTLDVYFSPKRNRYAAYVFFKRVLKPYPSERQPKTLNTDKHTAYGYAIARLIKEGKLRADVKQWQVKTLNNRIESDHAPIKNSLLLRAVLNRLSVLSVQFKASGEY